MDKIHDKPLNYIAHSVYCVFFFLLHNQVMLGYFIIKSSGA